MENIENDNILEDKKDGIEKLKDDLSKKEPKDNIKMAKKDENKKSRSSSSSSDNKPNKRKNKSRSSSSSSEKPKKKEKKSRSSSSSSEKPKKDNGQKSRSSSSSSEKPKKEKDKKSRNSRSSSEKPKKEEKQIVKKEKNNAIIKKKVEKKEEIIDEKLLEEKKKKMLSIKRFIRELSIKLANIHLTSKNFAKDKLLLFAGQKNFSGRTLKYIYNTISVRKNNLAEAVISVIEDCYCNSYKNPEEMKNKLITSFEEDYNNYNEIMNYLKRDEEDTREKYSTIYNIFEKYMKDFSYFKIKDFMDAFNNVLYKDLNEVKNSIKELIEFLDLKKINSIYYIFFRILYNISNSLISVEDNEKSKEKKCLEKSIIDPLISQKLKSVKHNQKKYILLYQLIQNDMINFNIRYENYNDYEMKIKRNEIKNPYFELFTKKGNLIYNSISLALLYPQIANDDNFDEKIKLSTIEKELAIIIIKIINYSEINPDNIYENDEISIFKKLFELSIDDLFKYADEDYNQNKLEKEVSDKKVNESNKILSKINSLLEDNFSIDEDHKEHLDYIRKRFNKWAEKFEDFNSALKRANFKKKGEEEKGRIQEDFSKLIKRLRDLDKDGSNTMINKAIKYLTKISLTSTSLKNSEKYVDCIIDEYENYKLEEGIKKAFIKFDIKQGDYNEKYEPVIKFQKVIKSLIEYTDCMNLVDKIKDKVRVISNLNKLDKIINTVQGKNTLKKSFKILRKNIIEDEAQDENIIQYFKDILLSKLLQEFIKIDENCKYLHLEYIYSEFNRFKERNKVQIDERKYASYLATILEPTYEIILPQINMRAILLLFIQKNIKGKSKQGLFFSGNKKYLFKIGTEEFMKELEILLKIDLSKISLVEGLNKLVDICKNTLFKNDDQIKPLLEEGDKNHNVLINYIYEKEKDIQDLAMKFMIIIIKNFYDSFNKFGFSKAISEDTKILNLNFDESIENNIFLEQSYEKDELIKNSLDIEENRTMINFSDKLNYDDFFFVKAPNWKENINETITKYKYLIYYLFKNPQIEMAIRNNLLNTEAFDSNNKNKFPIYVHLLRIFSSKDELSFQGKTKNYTSNLIEKNLIEKIENKNKKYFVNNISWIGLFINNALTISNKFIPDKISYLYNYLCKLSESDFTPSPEFEIKYKEIIEKLIDFMLDACYKNNFEEIFNIKIIEFEEELKAFTNNISIMQSFKKPSK